MGSDFTISPTALLWALLLLLSHCLSVTPRHRSSLIADGSNINATANNNNNIVGDARHDTDIHIRLRDEASLRLRRDGLRELRISFRGVLVLETSSSRRTEPAGIPQHTVRLVQATDGRQLVHTVLEGKVIKDCRWSSEPADVLDFVDKFAHGAPRRPRRGNVLELYEDENLVRRFSSNLTQRSKHFRPRQRKGDPLLRGFSTPLRRPKSLGRFSHTLRMSWQVRRCRRFQSQVREYLEVSESGQNDGPGVSSGEQESVGVSSRRKRDLITGWFIFPGTKWCGSGDIAEHKDDLGYDEALDKCCRDHDLCPHFIPRFTWRYELFNFRLHTVSHCSCDRRFRRCLKQSTSPAAMMVGKIFFNVVGPQCFRLSRKKTCKRRTWWGECKKFIRVKVAHLKDQRGF